MSFSLSSEPRRFAVVVVMVHILHPSRILCPALLARLRRSRDIHTVDLLRAVYQAIWWRGWCGVGWGHCAAQSQAWAPSVGCVGASLVKCRPRVGGQGSTRSRGVGSDYLVTARLACSFIISFHVSRLKKKDESQGTSVPWGVGFSRSLL